MGRLTRADLAISGYISQHPLLTFQSWIILRVCAAHQQLAVSGRRTATARHYVYPMPTVKRSSRHLGYPCNCFTHLPYVDKSTNIHARILILSAFICFLLALSFFWLIHGPLQLIMRFRKSIFRHSCTHSYKVSDPILAFLTGRPINGALREQEKKRHSLLIRKISCTLVA